ncbi:MAG TPA: DUF1294 domain-containing protein [Planctomycetes bacterium]|nr:DUF1294 domain-containing protein [Planctomycetota bacterium]
MHPLIIVATVYGAMSAVAFLTYLVDKRAAVRDRRRIPETTLHLLELLGGWPGALLAQRLIRHKNAKVSYQVVFWLIVMFHVAGWIMAWRMA